ncbi:threonyl-tRNA synthetase [Pseudomonas fluorescens]|nr:threonyl-tRNA synthetase [Pseudomonas fluorescens]
MIRITLPDGTQREYDGALSVYEVAASIGVGLAKAAVAGRVEGELVDCEHVLEQDTRLQIITTQDHEGLEILRRSCASLLAMAVKQLFPAAQRVAGAIVEDGFYVDLTYERVFTPTDLELLEARMRQLANTNHSVRRLGDFDAPSQGPLVPSTGVIRAFKLTRVVSNASQQRITATCWASQEVAVLTMSQHQVDFGQQVCDALKGVGVRAIMDRRSEKIGYKIREHCLHETPYLVIVGEKEKTGGYVSLRSRQGEDLGQMSVEALCERLKRGA